MANVETNVLDIRHSQNLYLLWYDMNMWDKDYDGAACVDTAASTGGKEKCRR